MKTERIVMNLIWGFCLLPLVAFELLCGSSN